ncbi:DNA polymerase III subunit gamma and tau [Corynebacterium mayonis]|uniref:DNA polymerase III subunit gamma and tau n=1 Tax=Corynebacterium mayonis TaxID=3062461 RepID=UPI00313FFA6C
MALYRKYRPATFGEVIGQEHVTRPLSAALDNGRINHAYLFSGPRGCGKTSSARILARSLNCVEGPTSTPCGKCASCVSLAPGGPGNLDVMEFDAASHGGVDEMRDLRERAQFSPAEFRYRVFIIDEAHMISREGNNALLKIVEEPPEHLIFIFATTEPEKMLSTIRSRTHNYPFRLLTPQAMRELVAKVVGQEGVFVEDTVYPLIIGAGGGSPRDTLSLLDQLLSGAGPEGLTYESALLLLGVTDLSLLDATVDALAERDAAAMFQTVDEVIEAGNDPRKFATDLLDRLRDLMILRNVPGAISQGLVNTPAERAEMLQAQAERFSGHELARLASEVNERVGELRGATSPRLLLEIMMAHLITAPEIAADMPGPRPTQQEVELAPGSAGPVTRGPAGAAAAAAAAAAASGRKVHSSSTPAPRKAPQAPSPAQQQPDPAQPEPQDTTAKVSEPDHPRAEEPTAEVDVAARFEQVRKQWTSLRQAVGARNQVAEIMLAEAKPLGFDGETLVIGHNTGALAERINSQQHNGDIVAVFSEKLGVDVLVRCVVGTDPAKAGVSKPPTRPTWNPRGPKLQEDKAPAEAEDPAPAQTPERPKQHQQPGESDWQAAARAASQRAAQRDRQQVEDIALPPEPADEEAPEDDGGPPAFAHQPQHQPQHQPESLPPVYSREDEERDMADQAQEEGERDRRDATTVAMDLLAAELGAKPL